MVQSLADRTFQLRSELHRSAREIFAPLLRNNDGAVDPVIFADLVCDTCREIHHPDPARAAADLRAALIRLLGQVDWAQYKNYMELHVIRYFILRHRSLSRLLKFV